MAANTNIHAFFEAFKRRRLALLRDDSSDKLRAVLVAPTQNISTTLVNECLSLTGGLFFVALSPARANAFVMSRMGRSQTNSHIQDSPLNGYVSVEAREGITTGISASDRAATLCILGGASPNPKKLVRPGHIFPIETRDSGVLVRNALPEGALDIVRTAGFTDAALFVDLLDDKGEFLSLDRQTKLAADRDLAIITLGDLIRFRLETENLVTRVAEARLPTRIAGELRSCIYKSCLHSGEHVALIKGTIDPDKPTLTRVQPEFTFGDVFGGNNPPSRSQLHQALKAINDNGSGVLVYLRRPASGQLRQQVASWSTEYGHKPAWMMREYGLGAQILRDLGVKRIELLTGTPRNLSGLTTFGIEIVGQRAIKGDAENSLQLDTNLDSSPEVSQH